MISLSLLLKKFQLLIAVVFKQSIMTFHKCHEMFLMIYLRLLLNNFDNKYDPSPRAEISVGNQKEY